MPMLNFRVVSPEHLIDINRIPELSGIAVRGEVLTIGAMTRQCELERSEAVRSHAPLLQAALAHVGHRATRNRGTLGGSLCHLDPAAELVSASAALDATLIAESSTGGTRRIEFAAWCQGYLTNALRDDEMLIGVEYPLWPLQHGHAFSEYARRSGDFAIVGVAALVSLARDGAIDRVALAVGGCAYAPQRLRNIEEKLRGARPDADTIRAAARLAVEIDATSDPYVPAQYRRHLARVLTERALVQAVKRANEGGRG